MKRASRQCGAEKTVDAVFFAEPRNTVERDDLAGYAAGLAQVGQIRLYSDGPVVTYLVRLPVSALPLLDGLEITLKRDFAFGRVELPLQDIVLAVIEDVVRATGSESIPFETCGVCGAVDPFSAPMMLPGEDGEIRPSEKVYCTVCARDMASEATARRAPAVAMA
ncbi:MAG TPA: hypothetical protein VGM51_00920 [Armatimonadota bacterium]|jgi:hypothetical protein